MTHAADSVPVLHAPKRLVLPIFEGPLDLLLHLVKVHEMDIYDIPIAEITHQYMTYLEAMQELNLEIAGDFLVMAATLLNIKSRSVLPRHEEEEAQDEEEIDEILSTQDLIRRLVEYRKFKEISSELKSREEENSGIYYRASVISIVPGAEEEEIPRQDIRSLYDAFASVLKRVRERPSHMVVRERFTVDEKLIELREMIRGERQINAGRLFERCVHKEEVICFFLALLEMSRLREITIAQAENYEDILIAPWDERTVYVG